MVVVSSVASVPSDLDVSWSSFRWEEIIERRSSWDSRMSVVFEVVGDEGRECEGEEANREGDVWIPISL